ncbi:preprotein translocase subunit SecE [Orbaceae bacterium ac157xtp]
MRTNSENKETNGAVDKLKWVLVFIMIAFVVWGNFYFAEPNSLYQPNTIIRIVGVVVVSVLALLLAATTRKGKNFINFGRDSRIELRKVVWPTRKETVQTTILVAIITIVVGLCLWGVDGFFSWAISKLTVLGH